MCKYTVYSVANDKKAIDSIRNMLKHFINYSKQLSSLWFSETIQFSSMSPICTTITSNSDNNKFQS